MTSLTEFLHWWRKNCHELAERNRLRAAQVPMEWHHKIAEEARLFGMNQFTVPPMPTPYEFEMRMCELKATLWDAIGGTTRA